jgi:long-chain acyl-CoA synthetase
MGEELRALVIPVAGSNIDVGELSAWMRERLTTMKCPRSYVLVEDLQRNTMGKINKRRLRDAYLAGELPVVG